MGSRRGKSALAVVAGVVVLAGIGWYSEEGSSVGGVLDSIGAPTLETPAFDTAVANPPPPEPPAAEPAPELAPAPPGDLAPPPPPPLIDPLVEPARAALPLLVVKGRAPKTGYDRDLFGQAWSDNVSTEFGRNGCDTRNDILKRDLQEITFRPGTNDCVVLTGILEGPFTGERIEFVRGQDTSRAVQIDHVVALSDAWQKGAQQMPEEQMRDFANDPLNLWAVAGWANQQKGAGDTATWLPPRTEARCGYVSRQILVKEKYSLWVTPAERNAMERIMSNCG